MNLDSPPAPDNEPAPEPAKPAASPPAASQWLQLAIYAVLLAILALLAIKLIAQPGTPAETPDGTLAVLSPDGSESTADNAVEAGMGFTTYGFGPLTEYRIDLPGGGGVIKTADSDWPQDARIELVWHGYTSSPLNDIVVRISRLPSSDPAAFDDWLASTRAAMNSDVNNKPAGEPNAYGLDGQTWHNLAYTYASAREPARREALDFNATQFGIDAVSISFYFPLPPEQGVLEQVVPRVLHSLKAAEPAPGPPPAE